MKHTFSRNVLKSKKNEERCGAQFDRVLPVCDYRAHAPLSTLQERKASKQTDECGRSCSYTEFSFLRLSKGKKKTVMCVNT